MGSTKITIEAIIVADKGCKTNPCHNQLLVLKYSKEANQ